MNYEYHEVLDKGYFQNFILTNLKQHQQTQDDKSLSDLDRSFSSSFCTMQIFNDITNLIQEKILSIKKDMQVLNKNETLILLNFQDK